MSTFEPPARGLLPASLMLMAATAIFLGPSPAPCLDFERIDVPDRLHTHALDVIVVSDVDDVQAVTQELRNGPRDGRGVLTINVQRLVVFLIDVIIEVHEGPREDDQVDLVFQPVRIVVKVGHFNLDGVAGGIPIAGDAPWIIALHQIDLCAGIVVVVRAHGVH